MIGRLAWTRFETGKLHRLTFCASVKRSRLSNKLFHATMSDKPRKICLVGSGNWGSAIAKVAGENTLLKPEKFSSTVTMYVYEEMIEGRKLSEVINTDHENPKYMPGVKLPENVRLGPLGIFMIVRTWVARGGGYPMGSVMSASPHRVLLPYVPDGFPPHEDSKSYANTDCKYYSCSIPVRQT